MDPTSSTSVASGLGSSKVMDSGHVAGEKFVREEEHEMAGQVGAQ